MKPTNLLLFLTLVLLVAAPVAAQTTQVQVIRYASDGTTVANQTTVDVAWMQSNLPVFGDGVTPYLFQGPLTEITNYSDPAKWNPAEDNNVGKVNETIKGTYVTDLCNLVGGMQPGGVIKVVASDGYAKTFAYDNVYSPQARQGAMVLAWWTAREGYGYQEGIRLFFGADTSVNPYGLHVFGNQDMKETFDEKYWGWYGGKDALPSAAQLSNKWVAKVEIYPAPSTDWSILLNGSIQREITKSYFESGLAWAGHRASYTDATGTWEGMPLWRLVGYVDDGNEHSDLAFNRTLAEQGYTIRVIAADGYNRTFSSQDVAFSSNYIVANTLNGSALPVQINGKNVWPLKLIGVNATGGKSVANITEIRVEGVPEPVPTTVPTTSVPTTPAPGVLPWTLKMAGYTDFTVTSDYFAQGMSCGGHTGTYTDANGVEWMGMPLWRLVGLVDDQIGHEDLIGAFNDTLAAEGYQIRVIAGDGYNRTFTSQEAAHSGNYLVASLMNGSALPEQVNGKYYWPLKLVGANATGGKSIANITEIRLENLPITPPPVADRPWTLKLSGYTDTTVSSDYFAQAITCGHAGTYTDANGAAWTGLPLWRLVGLVDDQVGHEDLTGAYNDTLADQGYTITVIAGDGFDKTFTSQEVKRSGNYLVASTMNGSALPEQVNGKNVWPLKLVGANATGGKSVGNITEIRLTNLPIAPVTTTATPTPTPTIGPVVLFDGDLTLKDGTFPCYAYNSGATQQVQNLTPNGALELASKAGSFTYNVTDKKWVTMGTMLLDGAGGYNLDSTSNRAWAYRVNGVIKNDFSSTEGISVYRIADGDQVDFYYGTKGGAYEDAVAVIRARIHIRQQTTVFDGNVTLLDGTFAAYAYNSGATWPVQNLTAHGALESAAAKGGFTYNATDKKWASMGTFLLDGVGAFPFNSTANTAWAYTLNGAPKNDFSSTEGISVQPIQNGDQLVFYFGVKGAGLENATAVVRIRVFVANDEDFLLVLAGARNATVAKADFDASPDRISYTDVTGTWSGIPLWRLVGQVDDADPATLNNAIAAANYTVRVTAVDGYNKTLNSSLLIQNNDYIVADTLNGAPLPETMWPLRLVGAAVPQHLSVAKVAEISLEGLPEAPPVGGDTGYFLVSSIPSGAEVYLEDISSTRYHVGNTSAGPLNVTIYLTATPMKKIIANLTGYRDAIYTITQSPAKGQTLPVDLTLDPLGTVTPTVTATSGASEPYNGPHVPSVRIEAEYFDSGGENAAYHDVEPQNLGNSNLRPGEGVDIETEAGVTNVAYIRAGEYLKYSVDTTIAGNVTLTLRAANPDATTKPVTVYLDGVPAGQVVIGGTGGWTTYQEFATAAPLAIPAGRHVVTLAFEGVTRLNLDWLSLGAGTVPTTTTPTPTPQTVPYGPGNAIPGRVQAENFDRSGTAAAYSDTTLANEGGAYRPSEPVDIEYTTGEASYNIGWIRTGEWLVYTVNVATAGRYTASFRAANPDGSNKRIEVYIDGTLAGTAQIGGTGSFGTFRTFTLPVTLPAGTHQVKLVFPSERLNLNYVEFTSATVTQPTVTTTTVPAGAASFTADPLSAPKGTAVKFTLAPKAGKTVASVWWSFDRVGHLNTWNSRAINPTFFYPAAGTYTPLAKITYTDGSTETVERANYVTAR